MPFDRSSRLPSDRDRLLAHVDLPETARARLGKPTFHTPAGERAWTWTDRGGQLWTLSEIEPGAARFLVHGPARANPRALIAFLRRSSDRGARRTDHIWAISDRLGRESGGIARGQTAAAALAAWHRRRSAARVSSRGDTIVFSSRAQHERLGGAERWDVRRVK